MYMLESWKKNKSSSHKKKTFPFLGSQSDPTCPLNCFQKFKLSKAFILTQWNPFWTSALQNCKIINVTWFKPLGLWEHTGAAIAIQYTWLKQILEDWGGQSGLWDNREAVGNGSPPRAGEQRELARVVWTQTLGEPGPRPLEEQTLEDQCSKGALRSSFWGCGK